MSHQDPISSEDPECTTPPTEAPGPPPRDTESPKAWERPRILWREPLEGVAVVCSPPGKADAVSCPLGPINS